DIFPLLFATADAFEEAGMRLREQQDLSGAPLAELLPDLEAAARGTIRRPSLSLRATGAPASPPQRSSSGDPAAIHVAEAATPTTGLDAPAPTLPRGE